MERFWAPSRYLCVNKFLHYCRISIQSGVTLDGAELAGRDDVPNLAAG
jgi:hypothetical protein